jgi:N-dimethylarginine dimethylaminohydrolase
MCAPEFFGVEYVINPWMQGKLGTVGHTEAGRQWQALYGLLTEVLGAQVGLVAPQPGLPDIVFTANAALVKGGVAVPSRFRHKERQGEEPHYRAWLEGAGFVLRDLPAAIAFEGAGDALFDAGETDLLWAAHGFRTDEAAHPLLAEVFGAEVVSLRLTDPRFYHLDTCLCPLPGGVLLWHPPAFDESSRRRVMGRLPEEKRIAVGPADAAAFACNAVGVTPADVVLNAASPELRRALEARGYRVHETPLTEFLKAGGSAKCLTLRLDA